MRFEVEDCSLGTEDVQNVHQVCVAVPSEGRSCVSQAAASRERLEQVGGPATKMGLIGCFEN